jgi:hypothetical protein
VFPFLLTFQVGRKGWGVESSGHPTPGDDLDSLDGLDPIPDTKIPNTEYQIPNAIYTYCSIYAED